MHPPRGRIRGTPGRTRGFFGGFAQEKKTARQDPGVLVRTGELIFPRGWLVNKNFQPDFWDIFELGFLNNNNNNNNNNKS